MFLTSFLPSSLRLSIKFSNRIFNGRLSVVVTIIILNKCDFVKQKYGSWSFDAYGFFFPVAKFLFPVAYRPGPRYRYRSLSVKLICIIRQMAPYHVVFVWELGVGTRIFFRTIVQKLYPQIWGPS